MERVIKLIKDYVQAGGTAQEIVTSVDEDDDNCTPLHYAASAAMVRSLLERGADMDAMDNYACMPLHVVNAEAALVLIEKVAHSANVAHSLEHVTLSTSLTR